LARGSIDAGIPPGRAAMALAALVDGERAWEIAAMINPATVPARRLPSGDH
jgi:cellobiose phosphorylase